MEDYTPSEPAEPFDEVDTHRYSSFPAAAPAASTASEPTEHPAARELSPPVPEHLDEMSDQPEPSTTPMNLDPVTSEAYRTPVAPETFEQQRLRLDKQETLSFGPRRPRHHEQPSPYAKPPRETGEMVFEVQDIDTATLPHGWTFNKNQQFPGAQAKVG